MHAHLHVAVGYAQEADYAAQLLPVGGRLCTGAEVRLRDDLQEGHARPVEVNLAEVLATAVYVLSRIFF